LILQKTDRNPFLHGLGHQLSLADADWPTASDAVAVIAVRADITMSCQSFRGRIEIRQKIESVRLCDPPSGPENLSLFQASSALHILPSSANELL
jgi:hypothetical protein